MSDGQGRSVLSALILAIGLLGAAALVGRGLHEMRKADRYVTVKGLVEREEVADLAVWNIGTKVTGDDLAGAQRDLDANVQKIRTFLAGNGFPAEAIETRGIRVVDRKAQEYGEAKAGQSRYIVEATV